ncbi:hypothetical protein ACSEE7_01690 [Halomonas cupida]|uniref:hypothetical protein n=1 Tax=Halomonas cupida TaxID=44933 RepID=UPI003EF55521
MFVELVAKAVYMWIDLSLIGNHNGQIEPFRSAQQELASLDLVFKGLTVDITREYLHVREGAFGGTALERAVEPISPRGSYNHPAAVKFIIEVSIPDIDNGMVRVESFGAMSSGANSLVFLREYKISDGALTLERSTDGTLEKIDNEFSKTKNNYKLKIVLVARLDVIGYQPRFTVAFDSTAQGRLKAATYTVRL